MTRFRGGAILAALALTITSACASSSDDSSDGAAASGGTIRVATVTGVLPYETLDEDGETLIGFEPDLVNEAAKRLDMKVDYTVTGFDSLLLGLDADRFDLAMAGMVDSAEREAKYDAIHHTDDKFTWVAKKGLAEQTTSFDDMCGKKLALLAGSSYEAATKEAADRCEAEGNPMQLLDFDEDAQGRLAVTSGQVDYHASNLPLLADFVKQNPDYAVVGFEFLPGPTALYLPKGSDLTEKLRGTLQEMVDDGSYQKILDKWDVGDIGIEDIEVNVVTAGE